MGDWLATVFTDRSGVVETFDDHEGAGTIRDGADGAERWFHCTRLADGSRSIATGQPVAFRMAPGPTGFEAADVVANRT